MRTCLAIVVAILASAASGSLMQGRVSFDVPAHWTEMGAEELGSAATTGFHVRSQDGKQTLGAFVVTAWSGAPEECGEVDPPVGCETGACVTVYSVEGRSGGSYMVLEHILPGGTHGVATARSGSRATCVDVLARYKLSGDADADAELHLAVKDAIRSVSLESERLF